MTSLRDKPGLDPHQFRTLFQVYRKLDFRSKSLAQATGRKGGKEATVRSLFFIYGLQGVFVASLAMTGVPVFLFSLIGITFSSVMVCMFLISEAGTLLFNPEDADVLGHLPVSPRTYFAVKCTNVFYFLMLVVVPLNMIALLTGLNAKGATLLWPVAHAISITLATVFFAGCIILFYGLLVRYVKRERVTSLITYCQVLLSFAFIAGYQVLPSISNKFNIELSQQTLWLIGLYPPSWFASLSALLQGQFSMQNVLFSILGLTVAIVVVPFAVQRFANEYAEYIQHLSQHQYGEPKVIAAPRRRERTRRKFPLVRDGEERVGFELILRYVTRDPEIKQRLLPSLAMVVFFPLMGLLTQGIGDPNLGKGGMFAYFPLVLFGLLGITVFETLLYSRSAEAAYVFRVAPVENLAMLYSGLRKAFVLFILMPGALVLFGIFAWLWKSPVHAVLHILPWLGIGLTCSYASLLWHRYLPLSQVIQEGRQGKIGAVMMFLMAGLGVIAMVQALCYAAGVYAYFLGASLVVWLVGSFIANQLLKRRRDLLILD